MSERLLITNARIVTLDPANPHAAGMSLLNGRIERLYRAASDMPAMASENLLDCDGATITPGFVDTHNHGAGGRDVMEASRESLDVICRTLARFGTTSYYPTTLTAPQADIRRAFEFLADYVQESETRPRPTACVSGPAMSGALATRFASERRSAGSGVSPTWNGSPRLPIHPRISRLPER